MFPGGLPRCFEFILGSDDLSRPFGESAQGDERRTKIIRRLRPIRPLRQLKPVPQEVDVPSWNAFPGSHPVPVREVRLRPNESLRERGRYFKQNIVSGTACLVRKRVGSSCAFDEREELDAVGVGAKLTPEIVALPDLRFTVAFMLSFKGSPLGAIAYVDAQGSPLMFCIIANHGPDAPLWSERPVTSRSHPDRAGDADISWSGASRRSALSSSIASSKASGCNRLNVSFV